MIQHDSNLILLSGFADEGSRDKTMDQQFSTMASLGLDYFSIRFMDAGQGIKNVLDLSSSEVAQIRQRMSEYGLKVSSIGSPIGKVKIADVDDGSSNRFVPFADYLSDDVQRACRAANDFGAKLVRGFSFYHPQHQDAAGYLDQTIDQLGQIADVCDAHDLTFGLEVEANLIGNNGYILADIHRSINHPALALVFDGGNLVTQGYDSRSILNQFQAMIGGLGWMHVKDHRATDHHTRAGSIIDEEALHDFVPADRGAADHRSLFRVLAENLATVRQRNHDRGLPGFFVDLEPHLRGGGQFGGFSGPDGMGIALRAVCQVFDESGIEYRLRDFESLRR